MKKYLPQVLVLLLMYSPVFAQNKSLGVGTATPNPNAALHVESPTNNQGIIIPRLSTAQRSAFTAALGTGDTGLIVFDTDLRALAIWNGGAWDIGSKVGAPININNAAATGNAGTFTIANAGNNDVAINGTTTGTGHAGYFEINNASNANAALFVGTNGSGNAITANGTIQASSFVGDGSALTGIPGFTLPYSQNIASPGSLFSLANSGTGITSILEITNPANTNFALAAATNGTGGSADFSINNVANSSPVVSISTNGTGPAISAVGDIIATGFIGDGSGLTGLPPGFVLPYSNSLDQPGYLFSLSNTNPSNGTTRFESAGSGSYTTEIYSSGLGPLLAQNTGSTGSAGVFTSNANTAAVQISNAGGQALSAINSSTTGPAAEISLTDPGASTPTLLVNNAGSGYAITANAPIQATSFIGDGSLLTGLPSGLTLPYTNTVSNGATLFNVSNTGSGRVADFRINNASSPQNALYTETNGTGRSADIRITNPASTSDALAAITFGTGNAFTAITEGSGGAAQLTVNSPVNSAPVLQITHAGTGNAINANAPIQATSFIGDGSGLTNLPNTGWAIGGNAGTTPGTDFIGTSDAQDVVFKANNAEAIRILTSGQVGIGSTPISAQLDVSSATNIIGIHAATTAPSAVQNRGLQADAAGSTGQNIGVYSTGYIDGSNGAIGVYGEAIGNGTSDAYGLYGVTNNFTATTGKTYGVYASAENGSTNWAGYFNSGNVHIKNALSVGATDGTFGTAGEVLTSQGSGAAPIWAPLLPYTINTASAGTLLDVTNSSGGMAASFTSSNGSQSLYVLNTGSGRAGMFNGSPNAEGVLTSQSGGAGAALSLFHLANGYAIDIQSGGLRLSNTTVVAPTTITTKAILYRVTGSGNVNLIGGAQIGETCWVSNETATAIDINGVIGAVGPNTIRQFVFIGSGWRIVN